MLHACLCTIFFVFYYTSRTNLLTRRHSASSLFSAVLVFQKSYTGNILGIGRNKSQSSYFSRSVTESKAETEGGQRASAPCHGADHLLAAPGYGVGPWSTSWHRPSTYIFPSMGKPYARSIFHETYFKPSPSSMRDREDPEALPGTLPERGITTGGPLHPMSASGVMCE
jgi:hypothetical protein